ncbi:hypothetical protein E4633_14595 [Geomonas terrae]|uniref:Uncharacterized protein n=1 Tax=Geomonas terrae TaxID=2562681 RepID=A0A4S1CDN5_9BACT|nr:hypothetical protein [Geomonas terrae]TGU71537.1 hypothetical protein E4633_14595 [Geomonas terrae]
MPSRNSFSSLVALLLVLLVAGCAPLRRAAWTGDEAGNAEGGVAILPLQNLSGGTAPVTELRQELARRLAMRGMKILPEAQLEQFMARHRLRYVGGVDAATAQALRRETGARGVLITEVELYRTPFPPRVALTSRLVTTEETPRIVHMESVALSGNDAPGLLGVGLVRRPQEVTDRAIQLLAEALTGGKPQPIPRVSLGSDSVYLARPLEPGRSYRVAVLPFFDKGSHGYAGEILALHFIGELVRQGRFQVIEPGTVREDLLRYRIIMEDGVSLADAELLFGMLSTDLILTGEVNDFEDLQGAQAAPKVDFSALLLERSSRRAVWSMGDHRTGMDRVRFFDIGRIATASALAAGMVHQAVEESLGR